MGEEYNQPAANVPAPAAAVAVPEPIASRPIPPPLPTAVPPPGAPTGPIPPAKKTNAPPEPKDSAREIVETVVFVVVLVLLLKTFLAEAFVIPTGSMADTLLGYHKTLTCEQCGYPFRVNLSRQVDPEPPSRPHPVTAAR